MGVCFIILALLLFARQFGKLEIKRSLTKKKIIRHPAEILIHSSSFMTYWAGLYKEELQGGLVEGVKDLLACAHRVLAQQARSQRLLPAPTTEEEGT